jgi:adenylate cyclase
LATERVERRLAAILAADVAGYSRLMGADEEGTHERLRAHLRELVNPKIKEQRGRVVKNTGDGFLAEFSSVVDAVRCAAEIQHGMVDREPEGPKERRIKFRIGINLGEIIAEGEDIFGDGVNVAARLEALAEPGGICVSRAVRDQVRDRLDCTFEDLGEQQVKNIARPVRVYRVRDIGAASTPLAPTPRALPLPDKPSIAVLPFANMSGDAEQEYFADGMVEEIITALSKLRWLFVIARNSSFTYKGRAIDVKQVGRELGVRYVLEGSVRKAGNRIRVTAQLVEAESSNHVWAERYDRELADIFAVQDEITEQVVATIEPELYAAEHFRSHRKLPESLDAWECVIRTLSYIGQGTRAGMNEAEALCRRAAAIAPGYAQARALLAWTLVRRATWSGFINSVLPEASVEARTALRLDEQDPWAHLAHGWVLHRMRRHGEASRALHRALELNPNFALAHALLGAPLAVEGEAAAALNSAGHALRLSPSDRLVSVFAFRAIALAHFAAAHYSQSMACARRSIERYPEYHATYFVLIAAAALEGDMETAREALTSFLHGSLSSRLNGPVRIRRTPETWGNDSSKVRAWPECRRIERCASVLLNSALSACRILAPGFVPWMRTPWLCHCARARRSYCSRIRRTCSASGTWPYRTRQKSCHVSHPRMSIAASCLFHIRLRLWYEGYQSLSQLSHSWS